MTKIIEFFVRDGNVISGNKIVKEPLALVFITTDYDIVVTCNSNFLFFVIGRKAQTSLCS